MFGFKKKPKPEGEKELKLYRMRFPQDTTAERFAEFWMWYMSQLAVECFRKGYYLGYMSWGVWFLEGEHENCPFKEFFVLWEDPKNET